MLKETAEKRLSAIREYTDLGSGFKIAMRDLELRGAGNLNMDAFIPDTYISNEYQKLDIYKRTAGIETTQDYDDMLEELLDRFGEPPKAVLNLLTIARIKALAHRSYVTEIKQMGKDLKITLYERAKLNPAGFPELMQKYRRGLQFKNEQEPKFILTPVGNLLTALTDFLNELEKLVEE